MLNFGDSCTNIHNHENGEFVNPLSAIKVLVFDQRKEFLAYVVEALHSYSFEVTCVDQPGAALRFLTEKTSKFDLLLLDCSISDVDVHTFLRVTKSMDALSVVTCVDQPGAALRFLTEKTSKFDLLLLDCSISDVDVHTFLRVTKSMDALSVVMSEQDDDEFIISAIKSGAFLVMKKPLTMEAVSHIRQNVIRERIRKCENHRSKNRNLKVESQEIGTSENGNLGRKRKDRGESSKQATSSNYESNLVFHWSENDGVRTMKKKTCVEWTAELHTKFINAVIQLGEGSIISPDNIRSSCYPKNILDLMAVPGLTRMQVASHLQKCRRENWKNDEKQFMRHSLWNYKLSSDFTSKRAAEKKFGCMPAIQINRHDKEESSKPICFDFTMNGWQQKEVNHMRNQTERGSVMTRSNQRNIEQCAGYTPFNFQSGYGSKQDEGFGRVFSQTTHDYIQPDAGQDANHHTFSQDESQAYDDFPDFLRYLDGNGSNDNLIAENIAQDRSCGTPDEYWPVSLVWSYAMIYHVNLKYVLMNAITTDREQKRLLKGNTLVTLKLLLRLLNLIFCKFSYVEFILGYAEFATPCLVLVDVEALDSVF
ncbi:two-component response regulator ORR26 [Artemisia annua]|uniref:Two-component response regulator ORR26 n=1 Tax=Artemisia annua TaxID=35608 RepID=A0A2U1N853_ARTAN|nr:two-component response regulator ORR26 [Artemisia annua]